MGDIWFTSDQHFDHKNIIGLCNRPFSCIDEMNETIVDRWNGSVNKNDVIYCLGDFAWKNPKPYIERLKGNIIFVLGGHDKKLMGVNLLEVKHREHTLILCHYPMYSWNKEYYGSIHLHGHIHNKTIEYKHNRINVSTDVWDFRPVPISRIIEISENGCG